MKFKLILIFLALIIVTNVVYADTQITPGSDIYPDKVYYYQNNNFEDTETHTYTFWANKVSNYGVTWTIEFDDINSLRLTHITVEDDEGNILLDEDVDYTGGGSCLIETFTTKGQIHTIKFTFEKTAEPPTTYYYKFQIYESSDNDENPSPTPTPPPEDRRGDNNPTPGKCLPLVPESCKIPGTDIDPCKTLQDWCKILKGIPTYFMNFIQTVFIDPILGFFN